MKGANEINNERVGLPPTRTAYPNPAHCLTAKIGVDVIKTDTRTNNTEDTQGFVPIESDTTINTVTNRGNVPSLTDRTTENDRCERIENRRTDGIETKRVEFEDIKL
ncbi:hypothetical protein AB6A40_004312 [Gnathostoma spinigerum]|uniref:Uncharacterized protein n=1 Tax=Gnathostoma spinigerum TaxID=75299 RepID=A0ABD6EC43_9BILA